MDRMITIELSFHNGPCKEVQVEAPTIKDALIQTITELEEDNLEYIDRVCVYTDDQFLLKL